MVRQQKMAVRGHILRRKGKVAFPLGGAFLHLRVEGDDHAHLIGLAAVAGDVRTRPVGRPVFEAAAAVGPELVERAQEGDGQPAALPDVQAAFGVDVVIRLAGLGGELVDEAAVAFRKAAQVMPVAARPVIGGSLFLPEVAAQLPERLHGRAQIQELRAAAGNDADRGEIARQSLHVHILYCFLNRAVQRVLPLSCSRPLQRVERPEPVQSML